MTTISRTRYPFSIREFSSLLSKPESIGTVPSEVLIFVQYGRTAVPRRLLTAISTGPLFILPDSTQQHTFSRIQKEPAAIIFDSPF